MGLLDFFGGGSPAEKAQKLKSKATQKYGDPTTRQKALSQLGELKSPDAVPVMMQRFTFTVDPQTTDADEKQTMFEFICDLKRGAVPPVVDFLTKSESSSSWALKILSEILPETEVIGIVATELKRLGAEYTRNPEKKEVLLHFINGKTDERVGPLAQIFLSDMSDEVKIAALKTVSSVKFAGAQGAVVALLLIEETAKRVQTACAHTLHELALPVSAPKEKIVARLPQGYALDKALLIQKTA
jgi:hypothetical protein